MISIFGVEHDVVFRFAMVHIAALYFRAQLSGEFLIVGELAFGVTLLGKFEMRLCIAQMSSLCIIACSANPR